ncbi:hypothetical protein [uncultured Microbacterium sp.]|uniref:hypothetical protein n=1 Tax=uncultured Microbacterium sp. TaxID=191216 RepID=UPI0028D52FEC|nr:hypothetical protein [uncultured Microbacterium sp.]
MGPWYRTIHDRVGQPFEYEFQQLVGFHRAHINAIAAAYIQAIEVAEQTLDPENYDPGDVYWEAEQAVGADSLLAAQHLGLMVLVRGVALAELTLAKMAALFFTDAEGIVFTNGKAWTRANALQFYNTALRNPYNIDGLGLDAISELRNTYAHGYGTFATRENARALEERLLAIIDDGPATEQEIADGYGNRHYVLGQHPRSLADFLDPEADLSPLTVHRLLEVIRKTVDGALVAAAGGLRESESLVQARFFKDWAKRTGYDRGGESQLAYDGPIEIRFEGKRVDVLAGDDDASINLVNLMADGDYRGRIELARSAG